MNVVSPVSQSLGHAHFIDYCASLPTSVDGYIRSSETAITVDVGRDVGLNRVVVKSVFGVNAREDFISHLKHFTRHRKSFALLAPESLATEQLQACALSEGLRTGAMFRWPSMVRSRDQGASGFAESVPLSRLSIRSEGDKADWIAITADAFATPLRRLDLKQYLSDYTSRLPIGTELFLLRDGSAAVATAATYVDRGPGVCGLYWVATAPFARRRGFSRRILSSVIDAFAGYELRLQSMGRATQLYESMGFSSDDSYAVFLPHYPS